MGGSQDESSCVVWVCSLLGRGRHGAGGHGAPCGGGAPPPLLLMLRLQLPRVLWLLVLVQFLLPLLGSLLPSLLPPLPLLLFGQLPLLRFVPLLGPVLPPVLPPLPQPLLRRMPLLRVRLLLAAVTRQCHPGPYSGTDHQTEWFSILRKTTPFLFCTAAFVV